MPSHEAAKTVIFVGARRPEVLMEEMTAAGVRVQWACGIRETADLVNSAIQRTVVITELALADGNWSDVVERIRSQGSPIPVMLLTSASTAELWWDALEWGIEDILVAPLSASRLCQSLETHFTARAESKSADIEECAG